MTQINQSGFRYDSKRKIVIFYFVSHFNQCAGLIKALQEFVYCKEHLLR